MTSWFQRAILTHHVGQTELILASDENALVRVCTRDYKSLHGGVTICATSHPKI